MQNRLVRNRGTTCYFVTCALGIGATENPKLSLLYVLILWPQMNEDSDDYVFQQDGFPAHFHNDIWDYLNTNLPQCWIGHFGQEEVMLMHWPHRSPDLTPCNFFLWGFVKDTVIPPVPADLQELHDRITAAVALIDRDMLTRVWSELDYRVDVYCISQGGYIGHLWYTESFIY